MAAIELRNIKKSFGQVEVIHDLSLHLPNKKLTVFVGPSGCGKSTLLRLIAGLEAPTSGSIFIGGVCVDAIPPAKRRLAMVFQSYALYPHMTVYENMAFGLRLSENTKDDIVSKVHHVAKLLHIDTLLDRKPKQLSGGQRQRVAIGRALVRNPKIYLFDEPLSNVDATLRVQMRTELARFKAELEKTMVYVTHDQVEAMTLADQIVVLNRGRVEQVGSPLDVYHYPANKFVASFIGSPQMNFLPVEGVHPLPDTPGTYRVSLPSDTPTSSDGPSLHLTVAEGSAKNVNKTLDDKLAQAVELGVRPENMTVHRPKDLHDPEGSQASSNFLSGVIDVVEHLGSESYIDVKLKGGRTVLVRMPGTERYALHEAVLVAIDTKHLHLFDAEGQALHPLQPCSP